MNISNIQVGQVFRNYKELCSALCVPVKGGKGKTIQHKEFKRYFNYEKNGHKYIITDIYITIKEKEDGRRNNKGGNNIVFADDIERLILYLLKNSDSEQISLSRGRLYKSLNMINDNYLDGRNHIPKLSELVNLPKEVIYDFYDTSNTTLRNTVERNLRRLRSRALIMWETTTTVATYDVEIDNNEIGQPIVKNGSDIDFDVDFTHRIATDKEKKLILKCEKEVMNEIGNNTLQGVFLSGNWRLFKSMVEKKLREVSNIVYYYDTYTITFNSDDVEAEYEKLTSEQRKEISKNINSNIIKSHMKSTKTRNTTSKNKLKASFGEAKNKKTLELRASETYVEVNEQLSFKLIDLNAPKFNMKK